MKSVLYISKCKPFSQEALDYLEKSASATNRSLLITGYLFYRNGQFIQYLEGPEEQVTFLLKTITQDTRHRIIGTLEEPNLAARRFPQWSMRYILEQEMSSIAVEIDIESILFRCMEHVAEVQQIRSHLDEKWTNLLWGSVNRLSSYREQLDEYRSGSM